LRCRKTGAPAARSDSDSFFRLFFPDETV